MSLAFKLLWVSILNLKIQSFFVRFSTLWVEHDFNFQTTSCLNFIR